MKTRKRSFWLTLALIAVCVCAAAVFVGCDEVVTLPAPHEHNYTEWKHNDAEHWRECPDDGAATEKSKHKFVDGKCECGLVDTREFGTVTGKITLRGGKTPTDFGGVTVDFEGDDVSVSVDENGNFTATHVTVGKDYDVTVSKEGYNSYTAFVGLETKDETVAITKPFTLEYKRFDLWVGWDGAQHDFSHVNDDEPTIGNSKKTLNVITREVYDDVAVSLWMKKGNSTNTQDVQGIFVKFEDGKYMFARCEKMSDGNYKLQWAKGFNGNGDWFGNKVPTVVNEWIDFQNPLTDGQNAEFEDEDGLKVTVLRRGGTLYTYADGSHIKGGAVTLPAEYADDKVKVGFFAFDSKENAKWKFDIEEDITEYESQLETFTAPADITPENGTVTFDKTSYKYGERATVTVTPENGYILGTLIVNGKSVIASVENNVYSFTVTQNITVSATFIEYELKDVTLTVIGHKTGENVQLDGAVTLTNAINSDDVHNVTLTKGTVTVKGLITPATYKVSYDKYNEGTITLEKGATTASVTLEYKLFDLWKNWDGAQHDFSHVNDKNPTIGNNGKTLNVITRDVYDDVAVSLWMKNGNSRNHNFQGLLVKFEDEKYMFVQSIQPDNQPCKLQWLGNGPWNEPTIGAAKDIVNPLTDDQKTKFEGDDGLKVTILRKGNILYVFVDNSIVNAMTLPEKYADGQVKVGFWDYDSAANATWKFAIEEDIASYTIPSYTVPTDPMTNGEVSFDKDSYTYGETAKITITPDSGYILDTLTVCEKDVTAQVSNNTYSFAVTQDITVTATFKDYQLSNVTLTVDGHKAGTNVPLGGEVTLTNTLNSDDVHKATLENGTVTVNGLVTPGTYKVSFDTANYNEGTITLAKGDTSASVLLEYKRFDLWNNWDGAQHDMSKVNDINPIIGNDGKTLNVISRDSYDDVAVSLWFKNGNSTHQNGNNSCEQGIFIKYADGKYMVLRLLKKESNNQHRLQWSPNFDGSGKWDKLIVESAIAHGWTEFGEGVYENELNSDEGLKVTLVRKGNMIYTMVNDVTISKMTMALPVDYADDKVQFGFFAYNSKAKATWKFDVAEVSGEYGSEIYQDHNGAQQVNNVSLSGESVSFVAKFRMEATTANEKRISIDMNLANKNAAMGFCTNTDGSVKFQAIDIWNMPESTLKSDSDENKALRGDGLYLAVTVNTTTGTVTAYIGTDKQQLKQISTKTDDAYKNSIVRTGVRLASGVKSSAAEFAYGNSLSAIGCAVVNA